MANKDVVIRISATDAASPVFKKVAADAKAMGAQVTTSSEQAARSLTTMKDRATAVGAGIGTLVGGMALAGRSFQQQENQIRGLNRAYGETSEEIQKFSKQIQDQTVYSDDQARQAASIASTLARNYGLTTGEIEKLIRASADLASVSVTESGQQFSLADAVQRTSSAIRGEAESAEALGLTMNQQAIDRKNLTLTMSNEEAAHFRLNALLEQAAYANGAAADAAETNAGKAKQLLNEVQDLTQEFGGALGPMGEYLSVLGNLALAAPLAGAAIAKLGSGLGALGLGPGMIGPGLLIGGGAALAYGYSQDTLGTTQINTLANQFFATMSGVLNQLLPGSPYDTSKYSAQMATNSQWDIVNSLLQAPGKSQADTVEQLRLLLNVPYDYMPGESADSRQRGIPGAWVPPTNEEILAAATTAAAAMGLPLAQYLTTQLAKSGYVQDPVSGTYMPSGDYATVFRNRTFAANGGSVYDPRAVPGLIGAQPQPTARYYGDITPSGYIGPYQPGAKTGGGATRAPSYIGAGGQTSGPFSGTGVDSATGGGSALGAAGLATSLAAAIKKESDAYYGLATASEVAARGQSEFRDVQDSIKSQEGVYSAQLGDFTAQVNAQDAAYEILNKRKEDGIALSKKDQDFLDNYAEANERGTGAIEDATVAQGELAQAYLLNMEKGDQLNQSMQDQTGSVGDLVDIIEDLILSMAGVPDEVRTKIELERAEEANAALSTIVGLLNQLDGRTATFYVNAEGNGVSIGRPNGVGITPDVAYNGITMNAYAGGGTLNGGGMAWVGERGPEAVWLPNGAQVTNTEGSKGRGRSRGDTFHFNAPLTVVANNPTQFHDVIRESSVGSARV